MLIAVWAKSQFRAIAFLSVGGAATGLAFTAVASTWVAWRLLSDLSVADLTAYMNLYMAIAFHVSFLFAMLDVTRLLLSERPDAQLFHVAPVSRRSLVTARASYCVLS